ncbi:MAG TPA: 16S rRNA (uracil(1498)-N(3))-methyltransferase [Thermoguttaceae bacterium]|nr:16S rRNA (uracil(1498)-N(3))-methyltransferase [Thermoguttaceae bacterium]
MTDRYFADTPISGEKATLVGTEAHHLIHVMRLKPGDRVVLFDGSGAEFTAQVARLRRAEAELAILARHEVDRELPVDLTLAVALPKGERQRWLVEKAVELGVKRLVPLETERSVARPGERTLGRLRRAVIEASKQCGRNRLMEIAESQPWRDFVDRTQRAPLRLLAHARNRAAETERFAAEKSWASLGSSHGVVLAVGPEGGFTDNEITLATSAGWQLVDLGPRTLRTETAAILLASIGAQRAEPI